jgi:hypothetical protein
MVNKEERNLNPRKMGWQKQQERRRSKKVKKIVLENAKETILVTKSLLGLSSLSAIPIENVILLVAFFPIKSQIDFSNTIMSVKLLRREISSRFERHRHPG